MSSALGHGEAHALERIGWLRAAVLGANDGLLSTAALIVGVATAGGTRAAILTAGLAGLVGGAMSMAAGEYVSVSSQADSEAADRAKETRELAEDPDGEFEELVAIYVERGLTPDLARQVATQMTAHDALGTHLRDELGQTPHGEARPVQAALASAAAFAVGAVLPLGTALALPQESKVVGVTLATMLFLMLLGGAGARLGGAPMLRGVVRVTFWGALAMAVTALIGHLFGTQIA